MEKIIKFWHSIYGNITLLVLTGIVVIAIAVSTLVLSMSKRAFTETYAKSQEKVFDEVEKELIDLNDKLQNIADAIDTSWAFRLYFDNDRELDNTQNFQNIYQMEKDLDESKASELERLNILIFGMNGKHYLSRTETISLTDDEIMESEPFKNAVNTESIKYTFSKDAYTATSKNSNAIVASKALYYNENKDVYAVMLVTLTEDDIKDYYDYFVSDYSAFYMISDEGVVICSSQSGVAGNVIADEWYIDALKRQSENRWIASKDGKSYTIMKKELPYLGCSIYGLIDNDKALDNLYDMPRLIFLCVIIGIIILLACVLVSRRTLKPLSQLVDKMSMVKNGEFNQYMPVEGAEEVKELATTYNYMIDDIRSYIDELIKTQNERRKAEIKALSMQINPHYVYNTLASIKWLVYQNNQEKTVATIDAFIQLLRNTISNTDEFITIGQEIDNLKNYVLINQTRYGDFVAVEYYVSHDCADCLLPKMILQPFIENAFFHAFPSGMKGTIEVFVRINQKDMEIKIADDGVGMRQEAATKAVVQETKGEHYSGIGIHNVHERLKLIYGNEYGVRIESGENKGTIVKITLPVKRRNAE
jgi:two-component system sensor histidine kinase YesM